jgi:serine/threonine protein kinase
VEALIAPPNQNTLIHAATSVLNRKTPRVRTCPTCSAKVIPGSPFCDACGSPIGAAAAPPSRKLRQKHFTTVKSAVEGLLEPGQRIRGRNTYLIEESIAKSGFGATFRALRVDDEKQLLIKQMLDQPSYDQFRNQLIQSFKREARFLSRIRHPAFPRGYEYFQKNKSIYLVMDFINGKELAKAIDEYRQKNGQVHDGLIVYLGMEIADALEVVHDHGYIYRDLKPQNVMLDGISSKVKLIDFGTLYHVSDPEPLLFESEGYTPPDLLDRGRPFTAAGDIYSLGALLYEAAMGETPTLGNAAAIDGSGRDARLCAIIKKCLAVNPLERYQRARQVKEELAKLTRRGIWPFNNPNRIEPMELSVLPKTLFPSTCTFCDICGHSDPTSQIGYCPTCRVPLKVGRLTISRTKGELPQEFYLNSDETIVGSATSSHFVLDNPKDPDSVRPKHFKVFRKGNRLWLESYEKSEDTTRLNRRSVIGPVELVAGDTIQVADLQISFLIKDAC